MSEPLSSTEIEDVLSSIRRLVSDDLRPLQRPAPAGPVPGLADKLILTPALRVVQDYAPSVPASSASPTRLHLGIPAPSAPSALEQAVASVGAAVDAQSLEWEAETGDAAPFVAATPQADAWHDTDPDAPFFDGLDLGADDAVDVFVMNASGDDMTDGLPDSAPQMPGWAQQVPDLVSDLPIEDDDTTTILHGTAEPDPAWADAAEASVIASLAADITDEDPDTSNAVFDDEPMLFDETVLRELVRDILREELAGRMGERITRNIRKLVRAEIARSFATQEFE